MTTEAADTPRALAPPGEPIRARLIANQHAGLGWWPVAGPAAARLVRGGWRVDLVTTERPGHATELAAQAVVEGCHLVVGIGGDGTLNEIVQAIAGTATALGIIPGGTANVLAREFGIPLDPIAAAEVLLTGEVRVMDIGRANGRAFVMMAGIGLDADVVHEVQRAPRRPHRWLKAPALAWGTVRRFFTYPGATMRLELDGNRLRGRVLMVVIGNIRGYAGVFQIAHEAHWDDNLLDVVVFRHVSPLNRLGNLISLLLRRHKSAPGVLYRQAHRVRVHARTPVPVQADGEVIGCTPMTFVSVPRALRVVMPRRPSAAAVSPSDRHGTG